jgi:Outer membrane protein beta-barrel domain
MSERHFFDRLRQKLSTIRPAETHKAEDWAMLSQQLDTVLPQKNNRRKLLFLPLLLWVSLVITNVWWWHVHQHDLADKQQAVVQIAGIQQNLVANEEQIKNLQDSVIRFTNKSQIAAQNKDRYFIEAKQTKALAQWQMGSQNITLPYAFEKNTAQPIQKQNQMPIAEINKSAAINLDTDNLISDNIIDKASENTQTITKLDSKILKRTAIASLNENKALFIITPKPLKQIAQKPTFQIGISTEYIRPYSTGLTAETGIGYNLDAGLNLSKHWRAMGSMGMMFLNYTATDKEAILGSAEDLPSIVNTPNSSTQMHMKNQGCMRYDLNVRYFFNPTATIKPFVGWGISGMQMKKANMDLQVQDVQAMMIHQSSIQVNPQAHKLQFYRFNAGFEVPLTQHFALGLEAYYMRQWNKTKKLAPDFMGLKSAIQYRF